MANLVSILSRSPAETAALGEAWGHTAIGGLVIGLSGDLGAGKTQLVKGLATGLSIASRINSPTFALVNEHREGRLPLFHLDLYRLESEAAIIGAGLEEYVTAPKGVAVVEWMERWLGDVSVAHNPRRPRRYRHVIIEQTGDTERRITYEDFGT